MKEKKILYLISGIIVCIFVIGMSFAFWYLNLEQTTPNVVTSGCFSMEFTEGNAISLNDAYPISDEEGMKLTPYTFTIQNTCTTDSSYQINLETITVSGKVLPDKYLKANLQEGSESKITTKLDKTINNELETETTIEGATTAYKLLTGTLTPNETKSYSLHLWMHSDVGPSSDSMNATYQGKINIVTSYTRTLASLEDTIKSLPIVTSGNGLYEVSHSDAEITYTDDVTAQNNLKQTELRYAGSNPNNYVEFNDELWRIIGLVNTPEGQRVKLFRPESIENQVWDVSDKSLNNGHGINEWSQSDLKKYLNEDYYTSMASEFKDMIDSVTWNTGANGDLTFDNISTSQFYNLERGNYTGKICTDERDCNDQVVRNLTWQGYVGLMSPSDYGYATGGESVTSRQTCLSTVLYQWKEESFSECKNSDWLFKNKLTFFLNPYTDSVSASRLFYLNQIGNVSFIDSDRSASVYPVIYLKENFKVVNGNGTKEIPYTLSR